MSRPLYQGFVRIYIGIAGDVRIQPATDKTPDYQKFSARDADEILQIAIDAGKPLSRNSFWFADGPELERGDKVYSYAAASSLAEMAKSCRLVFHYGPRLQIFSTEAEGRAANRSKVTPLGRKEPAKEEPKGETTLSRKKR